MLAGKEIKSVFHKENNRKAQDGFIRQSIHSIAQRERQETAIMTHRFTSLETETKNPAMNYFLLYNSGPFVVDTLPKKITLADFDKN